MKERFEICGFMNKTSASLDENTISRFRNCLVGAILDQKVLPKIIVIVPDDNIIAYMKKVDKEILTAVAFQ